MNKPDPLVPAGLEPPPASPFEVPTAQPQSELRLNRAARRRLRAATIADARLLGRVAKYDVEVLHKGETAPPYTNELQATYGLEHTAKAMYRKNLLSRAELHRIQIMARGRRQALSKSEVKS